MTLNLTRRVVLVGTVAFAIVPVFGTRPAHAQPTVHDIQIKRFKFDPDHIVVKVGDVVRWTNHDLAPHTATADGLGLDTGEISKNDSVEVVVTVDMATSYFCAFHPNMKGSVEIETP